MGSTAAELASCLVAGPTAPDPACAPTAVRTAAATTSAASSSPNDPSRLGRAIRKACHSEASRSIATVVASIV
jgi:hypothetical protein